MTELHVTRRNLLLSASALAGLAGVPVGAVAGDQQMLSSSAVANVHRLAAKIPFVFDLQRFKDVITRPFAHRQVVVATTYESAVYALGHAQNSLESYADPSAFAAGPNSMHLAYVMFEGDSPFIALDDAMYLKYPVMSIVEKALHSDEPVYAERAKAVKTNPNAQPYRDLVQKFAASFFVCNNALSGLAYALAASVAPSGTAVTREQVVAIHKEMVEHLLPGTMLVPTGVGALNAIQEQRFTFLPS